MWQVFLEDTSDHYLGRIGRPVVQQTAQVIAADLNRFFAGMQLQFCARYRPADDSD